MKLPDWRGWMDACCPVNRRDGESVREAREIYEGVNGNPGMGYWWREHKLPRWMRSWYPRCYWPEGGIYDEILKAHKWYCPGRIPTLYMLIRWKLMEKK